MSERRTSSLRKGLLYAWLGFATPMVLIAGVVMQIAPMPARRWSARGMARWWARGMENDWVQMLGRRPGKPAR